MLVKVHIELKEGKKSNDESSTPYMKMLFNGVLIKTTSNDEQGPAEIFPSPPQHRA